MAPPNRETANCHIVRCLVLRQGKASPDSRRGAPGDVPVVTGIAIQARDTFNRLAAEKEGSQGRFLGNFQETLAPVEIRQMPYP